MTLRYRLEYVLVRVLMAVISRLSRRGVRRIGSALGWCEYHLLPGRRRVALANLTVAFGDTKSDAEKRRLARASFQNAAATMLGPLWCPPLTDDQVRALCCLDPAAAARLRALLTSGRGALLVTLHFGDWELTSWLSSSYGVPLTVIARPLHNPWLDQVITRQRSRPSLRVIPARQAASRCYKALRRGEAVGLLMDQQVAERAGGIWAPLFGLPVLTTSAVAHLALRTGATIVFIAAYPLPDGRARIVIGPEIPTDADVPTVTRRCLAACEQIIRETPALWLWGHRRWRRRPQAEQGRYPYYSRYRPPVSPGPMTDENRPLPAR